MPQTPINNTHLFSLYVTGALFSVLGRGGKRALPQEVVEEATDVAPLVTLGQEGELLLHAHEELFQLVQLPILPRPPFHFHLLGLVTTDRVEVAKRSQAVLHHQPHV